MKEVLKQEILPIKEVTGYVKYQIDKHFWWSDCL